MAACNEGRAACATLLLRHGADPALRDLSARSAADYLSGGLGSDGRAGDTESRKKSRFDTSDMCHDKDCR
jgi:hypothetical protein